MVEQAGESGAKDHAAMLHEAIAGAGGAWSFEAYMQAALYNPQWGYYARDRHRVGKDGDFFTSVSVGRCFGLILGRWLSTHLLRLSKTDGELLVVEVGPEGGELGVDVMTELESVLPPTVFERVRYVAMDPLGPEPSVAGWQDISAARGVIFANEVLDAMPVRRVRLANGEWQEIVVVAGSSELEEENRPIESAELQDAVRDFPLELAEGFTTEVNLRLPAWFAAMSEAFVEMEGCLIDYGLEETAEFFETHRSDGTLRAYADHKLVEGYLSETGRCDITSHVDFECATAAALAAGIKVPALRDQHHFMVEAARGWLLELEAAGAPDAETAKLLRQFQSLSHPAAMGMAFKVMEISKSP